MIYESGTRVVLKYVGLLYVNPLLDNVPATICSFQSDLNLYCCIVSPTALSKEQKALLRSGCGNVLHNVCAYWASINELALQEQQTIIQPCKHVYLPSRNKQYKQWCSLCGEYTR